MSSRPSQSCRVGPVQLDGKASYNPPAVFDGAQARRVHSSLFIRLVPSPNITNAPRLLDPRESTASDTLTQSRNLAFELLDQPLAQQLLRAGRPGDGEPGLVVGR